MSAAETLEGRSLSGRTGDWLVVKRLDGPTDLTGNSSSVGYEVEGRDGHRAFMKASDLALATSEDHDRLDRAHVFITSHKFERTILAHCKGSNMDRVVVAIDFGDLVIVHEGYREPVFFLIFELAACDLRVQVRESRKLGLVWSLGALHNLAVGIRQLHTGHVCHNDIKPANILVFQTAGQKIADLGRATSPLHPAIHDEEICAGDPQYAAPELLYYSNSQQKINQPAPTFDGRRAADLYQLGSIAFFLFWGRMMTPEILQAIGPTHMPPIGVNGWTAPYRDVIPFWREAYSNVLSRFSEFLPTQFKGAELSIMRQVLTAVNQLCEPDPDLRGYPRALIGCSDCYSVERYVSLFNNLRLKAMIIL
jgi:serine/threonine protein kinase